MQPMEKQIHDEIMQIVSIPYALHQTMNIIRMHSTKTMYFLRLDRPTLGSAPTRDFENADRTFD